MGNLRIGRRIWNVWGTVEHAFSGRAISIVAAFVGAAEIVFFGLVELKCRQNVFNTNFGIS